MRKMIYSVEVIRSAGMGNEEMEALKNLVEACVMELAGQGKSPTAANLFPWLHGKTSERYDTHVLGNDFRTSGDDRSA